MPYPFLQEPHYILARDPLALLPMLHEMCFRQPGDLGSRLKKAGHQCLALAGTHAELVPLFAIRTCTGLREEVMQTCYSLHVQCTEVLLEEGCQADILPLVVHPQGDIEAEVRGCKGCVDVQQALAAHVVAVTPVRV